jgi:isoquinoline 1-oxidoreductase beta subunit
MTPMSRSFITTRRNLLKAVAVAAAGLIVAFHVPERGPARSAALAAADGDELAPNAFLRIAPDNTVTVISKHTEWGMGIFTGLATIIAEELDADWSQMRVEAAPANAALYANLMGGSQSTGGTTSIYNSYEQYRQAGATARTMLVAAAAEAWNVSASEVTIAKGVVAHRATGNSASFGDLAAAASQISPPDAAPLKDPATFTLIGSENLRRLDNQPKISGAAEFAIDLDLPGMLTAVVARPPRFGATVKAFDATTALAIPGVRHVTQIPSGVAVVADTFWAAERGREALQVEWDETNAEMRGSAELLADFRALLEQPGAVARRDGDVARALAGAARTMTETFAFPYLAHAPMEPLSVVVRLTPGACEIWTGAGDVQAAQESAAAILALPPEQVAINTVYAGGSFGRRAGTSAEAVEIAKAIGGSAPVKLLWTRQDDIRGGEYRPMSVHKVTVGLDGDGNISAWHHRLAAQSQGSVFMLNGVDMLAVLGIANTPYDIPNIQVELYTPYAGVTVRPWRGTHDTMAAYAVETMLDDIAHETGRDPYELRRALLAKDPSRKQILEPSFDELPDMLHRFIFAPHPRQLRTLELAAEKAGWETPLPSGRGRGLAVHHSYASTIAHVVEVTTTADGAFTIDRVVCAVDCGLAINPDIIRSQMEGAIAYGLSALLHGAITLDKGIVEQSTFGDYPVLRMSEMPAVEVHIVPSHEAPTGVGEPGVPPIGAAVANALFAATGQRVRSLPFFGAFST